MKKSQTYFHILFISLLMLMSACVGTVQESAAPAGTQIVTPPSTFSFPGIVTARPIAHSKVELEFYPAAGSGIVYQLFVNESTNPIPIDTRSLIAVNGGKLLYTVNNLDIDKEYKFKIKAKNPTNASVSRDENEAFARTFDNVVANFNGISKASLVPGDTDGAIKVDWITPAMSGIFSAGPYDPAHYEISIISEIGGVGNINNPAYYGTDKQVHYVPPITIPPVRATPLNNPNSTIIDGLSAGTKYFVQVRAIHSLYQDFAENGSVIIPISREGNTRVLSVKTDGSGSLFDFRQDNVVLTNATGSDAFDKIDVFWQAGSGSFSGYRVFYRKYDGSSDANADDKLTEATMVSMTSAGNYINVSSSFTSKRISGLDSYGYYQVKVALCKSISCPIVSTDPNAAIISDLKAIKVQPTLAPFSGINTIEPPGQYSLRDVVNLKFDSPLITSGFANFLEFYCVDPTNLGSMVKFDGNNPLSASGIANCDGLWLDGTPPALSSYTSQKVRGIEANGARLYCFAATPSIIGFGPDIRLATANRIVRCSYPEVRTPSVAQFPGLNNTCTVTGTSANLSWSMPTGGIYSHYKVYWKEKTDATKFAFSQAVSAAAGYTSSLAIPSSTTVYAATGLLPGRTYQMGILAVADMNPTQDLYSEYNLRVIDCVVPLPKAIFKGFSRIFAVGPKLDGRIPNSSLTQSPNVSSWMYEAIDQDGIPYEVAMDTATIPNISANFLAPPGRDYGSAFNLSFDGAANSSGHAMSKEGMVSLAWDEVEMSYVEADSLFANGQPAAPTSRSGRNWGYRIYRSADNKLTWQEMTANSGLIFSTSYTYRPRPEAAAVTKRMGFFTDYSVKALNEVHDASNGRDIDRARIYFYRIVPVFDGKTLAYEGGNHHIVKVVLPPPNMALVHRWMSNRSRCLELDKAPLIGQNYSCPYNGIGSYPTTVPHKIGETSLDQGGDLLIDRNELGCRYTRGDKVDDYELSASIFDRGPNRRNINDDNSFPLFRGWRTNTAKAEDTSTFLVGCAQNLPNSSPYPAGFQSAYNKMLVGDCVGSHGRTIATGTCSAAAYSSGEYTAVPISAPGVGLFVGETVPDCSQDTAADPTTMPTKYEGSFAANFIQQSEFMAVYYNSYTPGLSSAIYYPRIEGPTTGTISGSRTLNTSWGNGPSGSQCSINLAAIDGTGYVKPRWANLNDLSDNRILFKGSSSNSLIGKTVAEITEVAANTVEPLTLYNGTQGDGTAAAFKLPDPRFSARFRPTTRLARIMTSNSSKLPPLGRLSSDMASSICSTYWVQVGLSNDSGSNFSASEAPVAKRSLRRPESVAASAWPETFSTTDVMNVEASNLAGSCNNTYRANTGQASSKGQLLTNRMSYFQSTFSGVPLVTGSSPFNGVYTNPIESHTGYCISRYGVQDLVGNLTETNSERLFCDYTQDSVFLGPVAGGWGGGQDARNQGQAGAPSVPFFNTNDQRENYAVVKQGTLSDGTPVSFKIKFRNGAPDINDAKPFVNISTDSGYCSPVDNNPTRRSGPTNVFRDLAGIWSPLFNPGGTINSVVAPSPQSDQKAVLGLRNGDGRFLDFGPFGLATPLNKLNTMALTLTGISATEQAATGKYFNPVVGLPLKCSEDSCNDPALSTPNDNLTFTVPGLAGNIDPDEDLPASGGNFFIGNSQITNPGISEFAYSTTGSTVTSVRANGVSGVSYMLTQVEVDDPVTMGNPVPVYKNFPGDFTIGDTIDYYKVIWDVARQSIFSFTSGGKANNQQTGRFTASITTSHVNGSSTSDFNSGSRCAVLINQDP